MASWALSVCVSAAELRGLQAVASLLHQKPSACTLCVLIPYAPEVATEGVTFGFNLYFKRLI